MTASPPEQTEPIRPATFTDERGNKWTLRLDVNVMRAVRERTGFDLAGMFTQDGMLQLHTDIYLMVDVLWVLCESQAAARDMGPSQFAEGLVGDAIEAAANALVQAGLNFLAPARRATAAAMWRKLEAVGNEIENQVRSQIESLQATDLLPSSGLS